MFDIKNNFLLLITDDIGYFEHIQRCLKAILC